MGRKAHEMVGLQFGTLRVLAESEGSIPRNRRFDVECAKCGARSSKSGGNIRRAEASGLSGCTCQSSSRKHGQWRHPAYKTWEGMISRCYSERHEAFARYGGRGIKVCKEWRSDPRPFIAWLEGNGWHRGLEIDRIDNDRGYCPENCRVVHQIINANNRSNNRTIEIHGERLTVSEAARKFGVKKTTLKERLNRGWTPLEAVSNG